MSTINHEAFTIVSFLPRKSGTSTDTPSFQPNSIKREHDGEVFTIGDTVTNGTQMRGTITGFDMLEDKVFVNHTWSGVGMNLGSLSLVKRLPAQHQVGDKVMFFIAQNAEATKPFTAEVKAVHFYPSKVKYDLEIPIEGEPPTRVYNIDSCLVHPIKN